MTSSDLSADDTVRRLRDLLDALTDSCRGSVTVEESDEDEDGWWTVWVEPSAPGALGFGWIHRGDLIFQLGTGGVRWELLPTAEDLDFVAAVIQSLAAGRAHAVFAPGRAEVTVTLADGTREKQNNGQATAGCLPLPFWPRWGRRVDFLPYH